MSDILLIRNASRVVLASWLLLAFIIGTVYRGNLTAFLTLPKYPPRIETLNDLANSADRITMESWGRDYKQSFKQSGIEVMEKIADLMNVGPSLKDGLWKSLHSKQAQFDTYHSLLVAISEQFTFGDGTSRFYIGRETVLPGLSGWPIPHDAPFKPDLDWCILASIEAGLYDYWTEEMLSLTRQETRMKKREFQKLQQEKGLSAEDVEAAGDLLDSSNSQDSKIALTLQHMQGPLMLYLIGICIASIIFAAEKTCLGN